MKDQIIKMNLMKNKKNKKQLIEHVFLKIYLSSLIILIIFVPFANFMNNYNSEQFNNPLNAIECQENLKTSDPGPLLSFYSFQIDDDNSGSSQGDNDGNIDAGETIELRLTLENTGDEDALDVNATLSSLNNNITITNNFQDFITVPQGSTGMSSSFYVFKINSSCSADYYITIDIDIKASNGGPWNDNFQIHIIGKGNPVYYSYSIYSEADGDLPADHDGIIDAGEVIVFDIIAKNLGGANLYGITGIITESDSYTMIDDNSGNFGTINSNGGTNTGRFGITVSGACPDKHQIDFDLNLTDNEGTEWARTFNIIVNGTTDYEISDFNVLEYSGDGDGNVDAGEIWYGDITIKNIGDAKGFNVYVNLDSSSSYISFYQSSRNRGYGTVNINQTDNYYSDYYWRFTVSDTTPASQIITFEVRITDNSGYQKFFYEDITIIGKSDYEIYDFRVEEYNGDGDDKVDAGERWYANITIKNIGEANGHNIYVNFDSTNSYLSFYQSSRNRGYGTVNVNQTDNYYSDYYWRFTVSDKTPANTIISFTIRITDNSGYQQDFYKTVIVIGIPNYDLIDFQITEYSGDGDGNVDAGESWYANITIKNIGDANGHNVYVNFDSTNSYLSFYQSSRNRGYGTVNVNQTDSYYSDYYWRFKVSDTNTPENYEMSFIITITDDSGYSEEFIVSITIVEGGTVEPIMEDILSDIDWGMVGVVALIISCAVGIIGFFYANSHYKWNMGTKTKDKFSNYSTNRINKKQRKKNARELEDNKFENLIRKSKDLVNRSQQYYSKESFIAAVDNWKDAIDYYMLALKKAPSSVEKTKIKDNIRIAKENIFNAYIENGKKHNLTAKKAHKGENIQKAQKEWNSAKKDFQMAIDVIKSEKLEISYEQIEFIIKSIELNLTQLEIEKSCLDADNKLEEARSLQNKDLKEATLLSQNSFLQYSEAKMQAEKYPEFQELIRRIQTKMQNTRNFQLELQDEMDELIGITPLTTKVIIDDVEETDYDKVGTIVKAEKREKALSIIREYEFIGGQIRFKVALINNTRNPLTNFKVSFDIPDALKWIMHEPNYERKGDSVLISKVGINEKKAVSLYLEPINCMKSPINATVSFFDAKDRPQAVPMKPKMISITCPIFFTESEANLARVKSLQRTFNHRDRKIFPIINPEKVPLIYSSVLSVFGKYDIKLVFKEFSEKDKFGEAWFYGITKVKKNRLVMYIILDGENKTLELEVSGDNEEQITAFLAEIGNQIRQQLIKHNVITSDDKFYDIRISVLSNECPYCGGRISPEDVQNYHNGESIKCKYCDQLIINIK